MSTDADLLEAWAGGDRRAGSTLIRRHFSSVFRFFATKLSEDVDELVQRSFEACVQSRSKFRGDASFRSYVLGIARFQLLRYLQRDAPRRHEALDLERTTVLRALGPASLGGAIAAREEQRLLLSALRSIPIDLQIAVELHYWEDLSSEEVATVLEIPPGTVKSRLHRARKLLRGALEAQAAEPALVRETVTQMDAWAASLREHLAREPKSSRA